MAKQNRKYGSSNVLVRVYEKSLLTEDYFERLVHADDVDEVVQILNETSYEKYMEGLTDGNFEDVLTNSLVDAYEQVYEVTPETKVSEYVSLRYTYHNIKLNFKEMLRGTDLSHLYIPISPINNRAIDYAITSGESQRLSSHYLESINEASEGYEQLQDLYSIDVILDRRYLTHLRILADEIGDKQLIEMTEKEIDYRNIITLVRAMHQNRTRNFLNAVLSSSGSISKAELIELGQKEMSDVIAFYDKTHLDKIVQQVSTDGNSISTLKLEAVIDDEIMRLMQDGKRVVSGPLPLVAYIHAKEIEVKNLRIIYYAKSTDMSVEEINERLRLNYVT